MENKKQLIIIPPMSEALKKLNEVLEGIAEDENVEITLIDDLKELSQFVATSGQCLILASNAKKCANFLQENKVMLAKNHSKTILFTPKEIPNKTLIKFTKIGLTESILENSPPKTFLYKVKLQLRSIKTHRAQDESENLIKSLDNNNQNDGHEREIKEKNKVEENIVDMGVGKKKRNDDSGETIDYSNPLKGKVKSQEDNIDTNWKSDRQKHTNAGESEEENMSAESELNSIDMYYRGKNKKLDTILEAEEDEFGKLKKAELVATDSPDPKKSSFADIIDEGSIKLKRPNQTTEENAQEEKKSLTEIELLTASRKNKKSFEDIDSDLELNMTRNRKFDDIEEASKTKEKDSEDLGGYLKGKISNSISLEDDANSKYEDEYDNSEVQKNKKSKDFELDLLETNKKNKKQNLEDAPTDNSHDGKVDKIDGNMIGDSGTVEKIRTRMNGLSKGSENSLEDEDGDLDLFNKRKKLVEEQNNNDKQASDTLNLENEETKKENIDTVDNINEDIQLKKPLPNLNLIDGDKKVELASSEDPIDRDRQKQAFLEKLKAERSAKPKVEKEEDADLKLHSRQSSVSKTKKDGSHAHDSGVDKIDAFYRGGESKKKEQNWDNLTDKKTTLDLIAGQKRSGMSIVAAENKDLSVTTIDYRKLKEEFEMMSSGVNQTDLAEFATQVDQNVKNDDDEGSFKVIEIDPKCLDFGITVINSIYTKETKPKQIFAMITDELVNNYHGFPIFYNYKLSEKKFTEVFNSFLEINGNRMPQERKNWWIEFKKDSNLFEHFQTKSMTTWRCPEIVNNNEIWEDVELPTWAEQELKNKYVELIFPYFDGLDRMGLAIIIFPDGINPKTANGLLTVLEMARTLFLDTIERYQVTIPREKEMPVNDKETVKEKSSVLSFFGGLFGKKKAG